MPDVALPREAHDGDHERSDNTGRPEIPRRKSKDSTTLFPEPSASVSATRQHNVPATSNVLAPCVAPASVSQVFEPPAPSPGPSLLSRMQPAERGQTPPPEQGPSLLSRIQPLGSSSTVTSSLLDVDMLSVSDSSSDSSSMPSWSPLPSLAQLPASVKVTDWLPRARLPMWVPEDIVMDEVEDALYQSSSSDSLSDDDVVMTDEPVKLVVAFEPVPAQMELDSPRPVRLSSVLVSMSLTGSLDASTGASPRASVHVGRKRKRQGSRPSGSRPGACRGCGPNAVRDEPSQEIRIQHRRHGTGAGSDCVDVEIRLAGTVGFDRGRTSCSPCAAIHTGASQPPAVAGPDPLAPLVARPAADAPLADPLFAQQLVRRSRRRRRRRRIRPYTYAGTERFGPSREPA